MPNPIEFNPRLTEDTEYYDKDEIVKYVDYLEEQGRLIRIDNLLLDGDAMLTPFVCDTELCVKPKCGNKKKDKKRFCGSCCVCYSPRLSTRERERIDKILPEVKERFPIIARRINKADGYYHWDEGYDRMVNNDSLMRCVFMMPDKEELGFHGCAIHAWCLEQGLDPAEWKPSACIMFPLFLLDVDSDEGTMLLTIHSEEVMAIGESEENYDTVDCIPDNRLATDPIYRSMRDTIVYMFDEETWNRIKTAMEEYAAKRYSPMSC
ncbi:MAG: hypothetical protein ACOC29_03900 [Candidatus Sumerlaeota bacterium]